jgi:hypothetical protein
MPQNLETWMHEQLSDVGSMPREEEVVETQDLVSNLEQALLKVGAYESRAAGR